VNLPIHPYVLAIAPGVAVVAAGVIAGYVAAARRRPSTLPARLIFGGIGLAILGGAVLGLVEALAQRNLLGVLATAALAAPGVIFLRVGLYAREVETLATGVRTVGLDLGSVWRDVGRWQVVVSAVLIVAILVIAVNSGQVVLALLAIGPALTLLTGAALASIRQPDAGRRVGAKKRKGP
jgi:hypothetical protein